MSLYSISAEQSVLGELLLNSYKLDDAIALITPQDFIRADHGEIYNSMISLKKKGMGIDPITLATQSSGLIEQSYIETLSRSPSGDNFDDHIKIIQEFSVKRNVLANCNEVTQFIESNRNAPVDEIIRLTQNQASKILDKAVGNKETSVTYKGMMKGYLQKLKERALSDTGITGTASGFSDLDEITSGFQPADLIILAARPSMGKTASAMNIIENICRAGGRAMVFSMEMPAEDLLQRSVASIGRIDVNNLKKGNLTPLEQANLSRAVVELSNFDLIIDDEAGLTLSKLRARAIREHRKKNLTAIMIDYLQLMNGDSNSSNSDNRTIIISEISRGLKSLAKELKIPIIVLSQLNRSLEQRVNKRPINSDLRESGAIEQDADLILFVYRDEVYNPDTTEKGLSELIIGKHRNGSLGTVRLQFIGCQSRFENIKPVESVSRDTFKQPLREDLANITSAIEVNCGEVFF
jgi:replicative DNA helicase